MKSNGCVAVLLGLLLMSLARGQEHDRAGPELSQLAWLEGCCVGAGFGQAATECWMSAPNGRMTGMFQLVDDQGRQTMSEIFVLDVFDDGPAIRLKHFHPDLTGWEERDAFVVFPLLETGPDIARFDGLVYRLLGDGSLQVELRVKRKGEVATETLQFRRADQSLPR